MAHKERKDDIAVLVESVASGSPGQALTGKNNAMFQVHHMKKKKPEPAEYLFWAVKQQTGNSLRNLILIILADHMGKDGCFPSYQTVAERACATRRAVINHINELESQGLLKRQKRATNGMSSSNKYTLNLENSGVNEVHQVVNEVHQGSERGSLGVVNEVHPETPIIKHPIKHPIKHTPKPPCEFDDFYAAYPKKVGRAAAKKAWDKLNPQPALINRIMLDIKNRVDQGHWCTGQGKQYIPGPAPYLNQQRWEDEIIPRPEFNQGTNYAEISAFMDEQEGI